MDEIVDLSISGGSQSFIDVCGDDYDINPTPEPFMHFSSFEEWQQPVSLNVEASGNVATSAKYQLAEHESVEKQRTRGSPYMCSLCNKVFPTTSSLNKHLLTHQSDRPHICPVCQRAFKRPDHLSGHMLTHEKRKLFHCAEPGCERSYCDAHSLKRHFLTQHGSLPKSTPSEDASALHPKAHWEPTEDTASNSKQSSFPTLFISATKSTSDPQFAGSNYHSYVKYSNYTGFPNVVRGLGGNHLHAESAAQDKTLPAEPDQWIATGNKAVITKSRGEVGSCQDVPSSSEWTVALETEVGTISTDVGVVAGKSFGTDSLSVPCWENAPEFPVTDLQALDNILSFQSTSRETAVSHISEDRPQASPETARHSKLSQHIHISQGLTQVKKLELETLETARPQVSSGDFTSTVDLPAPAAPEIHVSELEKRAIPKKADRVKKKASKKKTTTDNALPLPAYNDETNPWHLRPEFLLSPSQVAMASFTSDSAPYLSIKGGNVSVIRRVEGGQEAYERSDVGDVAEDSYSWSHPTSSMPPEQIDSEPEPSAPVQVLELITDEEAPPQSLETCLSPLIIPVSVPVSKRQEVSKTHQNFKQMADKTALQAMEGARLKKPRRLESLKSLIIPSPFPVPSLQQLEQETVAGGLRIRATGGFLSQLRSPTYVAGQLTHLDLQIAPYTPPPMLSPLRPGSGLYFNKQPQQHPCPPLANSFVAAMEKKDGTSLVVDDSVVSIEPRINVGSRFQAEIPPLRNQLLMLYEDHPAQLVWSPWGDIDSNTDTQERVTEFLNMCCSSVLPGGGTNTELALHCLHEAQGNTMAALDLLLVRGDFRFSSHPLSDYHYSGSDFWSAQEKRIFQKAVITEHKDFQRIQKILQTKTVYQCVEYYYAMKKLKKFKNRSHTDRQEGTDYMNSPCGPDAHQASKRAVQSSLARQTPAQQSLAATDTSMEYTCEECGRGFEKVRSRSAHMKTHRHQERCSLVSNWSAVEKLVDKPVIPAVKCTSTPESDCQRDTVLAVTMASCQDRDQSAE
ncbi:zinc finger protein 541 isoform X2 [Engraulis encrasicolus]|uniref:zinc finger protein 541 isoform X2 n=1 Tax=Engraulis encrasicolus TaxID=184585 RepID=UPI002FD6D6BB